MLKDKKLGFLGAGNMGEALIKGLLNADGEMAERIWASDVRADRRQFLGEKYGIQVSADNREVARIADILVLAVKPQIMEKVVAGMACEVNEDKLLISVAAGFTIGQLEQALGKPARLIRTMPNVAAIVAAGATAVAAGENAREGDLALACEIFDSVGISVTLDEILMDAVTGLSGSGPAYVFMIIEALSDAGVKVGLPRYIAQKLAAQTVLGSAQLLMESGEHPGVLKDMVTSPGGTAIAGLHTLESGGLRTTLINAVETATLRSQHLGKSNNK